jgi:hypothetical protein
MSFAASPLAPPKPRGSGFALGCAIPFGLIFTAVGLLVFWLFTARPLLLCVASADWTPVPCEILSSELAENSSSDGSTYRVAIRYRYQWLPAAPFAPSVERGSVIGAASVARQTLESDRFDFSGGSTNIGVKAMRAAVRTHSPGSRHTCYVDPADPASAVLSRRVPGGVWLGGLMLLFPVFGIGFIAFAWRSHRKTSSPLAASIPALPGHLGTRSRVASVLRTPDASDPVEPGETVLKLAAGRFGTFVGLLFFACFWNGILGIIAWNMFGDFGDFAWFGALFLIPFLLVGLLLLGLTLQAFSRLFAPPVEVRLDPSLLRLGARVPFTWRLGGGGVHRLVIRLVAREEATYRQGTNTRTDKSDCHRAIVFESTDILSLAEGRAELVLPADAIAPSFSALNSRLVWELAFDGEISWRADIDDRFLLAVRGPDRPAALAATPEPREYCGGGLSLWTVDRFAPGETLVFTLARDADTASGSLTAQLGWLTEGKGTRDTSIAWSQRVDDLAHGSDRSFELRLPATPWSFSGKLVAVEWRLEVLDAKGELLVAVPLVIAPGGSAPYLPALPAEPSSRRWKRLGRGFR